MFKLNNGYGIKNQGDTAELYIYGVIGDYFDGMDALAIAKDIKDLDVENITVRINSPGGSVYDGMAIMSLLKRHPANVKAIIDGHAMSAATVIMLGADEIEATEGSFIMIHDAWTFAMGNAKELQKTAEDLETISAQIADLYVAKTGKPIDEIRAMMDEEKILTAAEALEFGLIDSTDERMPIAACAEVMNKYLAQAKKAYQAKTTPKEPIMDTDEVKNEAKQEALAEERQRVAEVNAAFQADPAFANSAIEAGQTVAEAKAAYSDVLAQRIEEVNGKLEEAEKRADEAEKELQDVKAQLKAASESGIDPLNLGGETEPKGGETDDIRADFDNNVNGCKDDFKVFSAYKTYRNSTKKEAE